MEDKLINAMKSEPDFRLSERFSAQVLTKILRKERATVLRNNMLLALGIILFLGISFAALVYFMEARQVSFVVSLAPWILLISGAVAIIQFLDAKLIKHRLLKV